MSEQTDTGASRHAYPPRTRLLTVIRTEELSSGMRRVVLTGEDLEATMPFAPLSVATHVKIVVPDAVTGEVVLPKLGEQGISWTDGVIPAVRDYTVRRFDPERRELSLDFVLHEHGPAGRWAIDARPGDRLGVMGPRGYTLYPGSYDRYVLSADETALPATERWIEEAPRTATLEVFVLVTGASAERRLPEHPGLRLHWLHRDSGDDLAAALAGAVPVDDGHTFVWAAGEASSLQPLRQHLREAGFGAHAVDVHGYWRHGTTGHHDSHDTRGQEERR